MTANSVDTLPDTPEFAQIRQHPGTFIVAPGFDVSFEGTFGTINGSIAADKISFLGTSEGTIKGTIIGLADEPMILEGNVEVCVDKSGANTDPSAFLKPFGMGPLPDTYCELRVAP